MKAELTIGPILFHWPAEQKRDFYFKIADEAPVDTVYIGEVICSKRAPFFEKHYAEISERLKKGGKKVIFSSLAEIMIKRERKMTEDLCALDGFPVEANDSAALYHLRGKPHHIGPFMNIYNEDTLEFLAARGATHFTLPPELPATALDVLGQKAKTLGVTLEVQVYGRLPLALSARCYHARSHGRVKDNCQLICENDPDGMVLETLEGEKFLTINGIQTLSYGCLNLMQEMEEIQNRGVNIFRLSPHSHDMVQTAKLFRAVLDRESSSAEASAELKDIGLSVPFANGFYHGEEGYKWVQGYKTAIAAE